MWDVISGCDVRLALFAFCPKAKQKARKARHRIIFIGGLGGSIVGYELGSKVVEEQGQQVSGLQF